jgi:serine protease Do
MTMRFAGMRAAVAAVATVALVGATARCGTAQEKPEKPDKPEAPEVVIARMAPFGVGGSFLGVHIQEVDATTVERLKLEAERGARVADVTEDGPAAKAGVRDDDVIVAWNGAPVESAAQLRRLVSETPAGRQVKLTVVRDGKRLDLPVEVAERPAAGGAWTFRTPAPERMEELERRLRENGERLRVRSPELRGRVFALMSGGRLGVSVQTLGDQLGAYFGLDGRPGVLVTSVGEDSPAAKGGLKAGDVILAFGGEEVAGPGELVEAVREADEGPVPVRVLRDRKERTVTVELPEAAEARWEAAPSAGVITLPELFEGLGRIEIPDFDLPTRFRFEREPQRSPPPGTVRV